MKVYISGKITGEDPKEVSAKFAKAEKYLKKQGHIPINPYKALKSLDLDYEDYIKICFAMIDVSDALYMLADYKESQGAMRELAYAGAMQKFHTREVADGQAI